MKKMKKALALLLAVMTVFSLAACGAKKDDAAADTTSDPAGDTTQEETSSTPQCGRHQEGRCAGGRHLR